MRPGERTGGPGREERHEGKTPAAEREMSAGAGAQSGTRWEIRPQLPPDSRFRQRGRDRLTDFFSQDLFLYR